MDLLSRVFAEQLIFYRTQRGKKQKELAAAMEVTPSTVSSWESGTYSPKLSTLCKISDYLEVPVDALLGLDHNSSEVYTAEEKNLIAAYREHKNLQYAVRVLLGMDCLDTAELDIN